MRTPSLQGYRGFRINRATANLPQTATQAIFTVTGGRILLVQILGEVTTVFQALINNLKLQANPTVAGASVDLCANLDVNGSAVGTLFGITGTFADALMSGLAIRGQDKPTIIQAGTIDLVASASATGQAKWQVVYEALDRGARVVAA